MQLVYIVNDLYYNNNNTANKTVIIYSSVTWNLSHSAIENLCIAWRQGLRRLWFLSFRTHEGFWHVFVVFCLLRTNSFVVALPF